MDIRLSRTAATSILGVLLNLAALGAQMAPKPVPLDRKDPGYVNSKSMATPWPLTVPEVILKCQRIGEPTPAGIILTLKAPDGKDYAANETAAKVKALPSFEAIRAENPKSPGTKINAGPLLTFGYRLCD
jgi:hypothetical protein